jgi:hypothetical protein
MTRDLVKRTVVMFLGLSIVMVAAYAYPADPADVNGTWVGSNVRGTTTMTLVMNQTGSTVTGTIAGVGAADGPITGVVDGNTIRIRFDSGYEETPLLNVKGDRITGLLSGAEVNLRRVKKSS